MRIKLLPWICVAMVSDILLRNMADHVYIDMNEQSYDVQAPILLVSNTHLMEITQNFPVLSSNLCQQHNEEENIGEYVEPLPSIYRHPPSDNRKVHSNTCGYQELQQQGGNNPLEHIISLSKLVLMSPSAGSSG